MQTCSCEDQEMLDMMRATRATLGKVLETCRMEVDDTRDETIEDDDHRREGRGKSLLFVAKQWVE